jgi:peptidoglycan hydrolase-like protein with peptidoglycan-binding domain
MDASGAVSGRKDLIAALILTFAACGIASNALFLQKGPHPSPMFHARPQGKPVAAAPANPLTPAAVAPAPVAADPVVLPRPRPLDFAPTAPVATGARSQTDIVIDIQRELSKRGFYDGVADGVYGAKTDTAIRDFEHAAGMKPGEPNETFLAALTKSPVKYSPAPAQKAAAPRPPDPIAELIAPTKRVTAIQRALSDYGYGQLKVTGTLDRDTQEAIEQFERARKLPVTGQIGPRLLRELSAVTGRPLE